MSANALHLLAEITIASSAAVLLVALLRKPLRHIAGARIAYWLWLAVPTNVLAVWLPLPSPAGPAAAHLPSTSLAAVIPHATVTTLLNASIMSSAWYGTAALVIWVAGVLFMAIWFVLRQKSFIRSLGALTAGSAGDLRSECIGAPMLLGAWRPKMILPADFEALYPEDTRVLMLAHERAHRERGDGLVNAMATAWLCLSWFNPLMYWAIGRLQFDQEVACDALVLARAATGKRRYAEALLKAQIRSDDAWRIPIGCHWQSGHPLKERIAMLKLPTPRRSSRFCGLAFATMLTAFSMAAVSVGFAQTPNHSASDASHSISSAESPEKRFSLDATNTDVRAVLAMIARKGHHNVLVSDHVTGKITLHLKGVTWPQALHIVMLSQGLVARQSGDITIVAVPHH